VKAFASPVAAQLDRTLDVPLTFGERTRIAVQLGSSMLGGGLLVVGLLQRHYGSGNLADVAELIMALAACVVALPIFFEAIRGLIVHDPHSYSAQLVSLAVLAAMATGDFLTATLIPIILHLGHFFEERSVVGAQAAIQGLQRLHARKAMLLTDEGERQVDPDSLRPGDVLVVRPGDVIAADGEVTDGSSAVDQSSITGESVPEDVTVGSPVYAASVNLSGLIRVRVTKSGSDTALGRVMDLLREAERSKPPALKLIERYAGYYVPIVLTIAGVVLFATREMSRAVAVLVVGCPGALVLAGPTAMVAALAAASRLGILIKNTKFLESLADVDTVVFDKTGTVTRGQLELVDTRPVDGISARDFFEHALPCAAASRHPVSRAIVEAAERQGISITGNRQASEVKEVSGKGLQATVNGRVTRLGRREWLGESGWHVPENPPHAGPIVWLGQLDADGGAGARRVLGCLLLADACRPEAKQAVQELRTLGVSRTVLLTGDRQEVAQQVGASLEIDEVIADVLPAQKLDAMRAERAAGRQVMMVGDGVNDALALRSGDVGVALGAVASDVALKSADVALMANDLGRLPTTIKLARRTRSTIHANILIGAGISLGFVWLASIGVITALAGAMLHTVGELFVIFNSARLLAFGQRE